MPMASVENSSTAPQTNILLVDEELADLLYLESILKDLGQNLVRARSGREALAKLEEKEFAVVLLGVQMRVMDGFETAKRMRQRLESIHTPIIFLTAAQSKEFPILDAYKIGAVDYLIKPYPPEVLRAKVKALVELYQKTEQVREQAERLRHMEQSAFDQKFRAQAQQWEMERLRQEAAIERKIAEALREADRRKDEFLAMLAHELRNPLAPIRNAVYILKQTKADPSMVRQAEDMIERQVQHMARLLDDLLDVSRISRGKIDLRREPLAIAALVERTVEAVRPLIKARHHELSVRMPSEPLWVQGDTTRLEQVLTNLLNNATNYTDPGGQIHLSVEAENANVVLRVRDTGVGLAPELLPHIFDLFVQGAKRPDRAESGLGIGLTLVKTLVEMHGGTIEAHSPGIGLGSEFVVRLPALGHGELERQKKTMARFASETKLPVRRILVVDDKEDAAQSLAMLLRLKGHEVQVALDGPAALELARSCRAEVALLDIGMQGMDGYELARRLRQEPDGQSILLIALTGWGQADDRQRSQEAGFDYHLVKPVDPESLQELLTQSESAVDSLRPEKTHRMIDGRRKRKGRE
jgi:signal transduction histidine kinase